jgi:hypothetical protein
VYGQVCSAKSSAQLASETRKQLDGSGRRFFRKRREMPVADHVANNIGRMEEPRSGGGLRRYHVQDYRGLGEHQQKCFVVGYVADREFEVKRDPIAIPCEDDDAIDRY